MYPIFVVLSFNCFPLISIVPLSGMSNPAMSDSNVDFPQPEGPTMLMNSPFFRKKESSFSAGVSPSVL